MAECLRFLSATWTPEILWFLHGQSRRFGDLRRDLAGISAKVLTVRLRELERRAVVRRTVKPTSPPTVEYSLTELGRRFVPVLEQIAMLGGAITGRAVMPADHFPPGPSQFLEREPRDMSRPPGRSDEHGPARRTPGPRRKAIP